jgi:threonylcarbamoyladenosine tRNA methylthiotransferase MtaB
MESDTMGRTEQFTETRFTRPQIEGSVVFATITGHGTSHLTVD